MSETGGHAKVCVVCGTDCSRKPRTKDPKGRYYCRPCYEKVHTGHSAAAHGASKAAAAVAPSKKPPPKPKPVATSGPGDLDDGLMNLLDDLIPEPPPQHIATDISCPGCGKPVTAGIMLCTNCGYNFQTHAQASRITVTKTPRQATGGVIWPPLVGWTSFGIGVLGFLIYGGVFVLTLLSAFQAKAPLKEALVVLGIQSLFTWLAAWLARDGYRIAHRNSDGVKWIRFWALAKMLIFGTCLSLVMAVPVKPLEESLRQVHARGGPSITASEVKQAFLLIMAFFMAWPIFTLVFFFIPRIQDDVETWD